MTGHLDRWVTHIAMTVVGAAAFLYPFWLPSATEPGRAHAATAPLIAATLGALAVAAVLVDVRAGRWNGSTVALLGVLSAMAGFLRLLDLPAGGTGMTFLVVLAGAAFGPRFGHLLGMLAMAFSSILTAGIGPWLPFQMLTMGWIGAGAGVIGLVARGRIGPWVLAAYGWGAGFAYGAVMNLWFWPFQRQGPTSWVPGMSVSETLERYWSFYALTSLAWDAAGAFANAVLIVVTAPRLLPALRRFASRLDPRVELAVTPSCGTPSRRTAPAR
jgi:energy-coupling factor transport system substrate-specific component